MAKHKKRALLFFVVALTVALNNKICFGDQESEVGRFDVVRSSRPQKEKSPEDIKAQLNVLMEKIFAWNHAGTKQKAKDIYDHWNMSGHDKLKKLKRLMRLVNEEFDKLAYVKEPGKKFTKAEIFEQEEAAFDAALRHMNKKK